MLKQYFIFIVTAISVFSFYHGLSAQETGSYPDFSSFSDEEKNEIVTGLFQRQAFDSPESKAICQELLATQSRFSFANASVFTQAAIDLAEKQHWLEYDGLIAEIYKFPSDPAVFKRAFTYLRKRSGKPIPEAFLKAWEAVEDSCLVKDKSIEKKIDQARQTIVNDPDKEMVLVFALCAAATSGSFEATDRCQWIAIDILKSLDRRMVFSRLKSFQPHPDSQRSAGELLERIRSSMSSSD